MKVVFFSSIYPGPVNLLSINYLMQECPDFEYHLVVVNNRTNHFKMKVIKVFKSILLFLLFKRSIRDDSRKAIESRIREECIRIGSRKLTQIIVKDCNGLATEQVLIDLKPDVILQCGAGILKKNIFNIARFGALNVHHGIAPEIRGISSTFWALFYGRPDLIGTTIHLIDETLDTGLVIIQKQTQLGFNCDYIETQIRTILQGVRLLPEAINILKANYKVNELSVDSFYFSKVSEKHFQLLEANSFQQVKSLNEVKSKIKCKKIIELLN